MPDQSQSNESVSGKTGQEAGNPADTSANTATAATAESLESNVTRASEGEVVQADQTINRDPHVGNAASAQAATQSVIPDDLNDEDKYQYRDIQRLAKDNDVDASGKRDEIVARLRAKASEGPSDDGGQQATAAPGDDEGTPRHLQGMETIDGDPSAFAPVPRASVDPAQTPVGGQVGFGQTGRGADHAEILQGMSNERRAQQLAAVSQRSEQQSSSDEE